MNFLNPLEMFNTRAQQNRQQNRRPVVDLPEIVREMDAPPVDPMEGVVPPRRAVDGEISYSSRLSGLDGEGNLADGFERVILPDQDVRSTMRGIRSGDVPVDGMSAPAYDPAQPTISSEWFEGATGVTRRDGETFYFNDAADRSRQPSAPVDPMEGIVQPGQPAVPGGAAEPTAPDQRSPGMQALDLEGRFGASSIRDLQMMDEMDRIMGQQSVAQRDFFAGTSGAQELSPRRANAGGGVRSTDIPTAVRPGDSRAPQVTPNQNIPSDVRAIISQGGPRTEQEARRFAGWQGTTQGREFAESTRQNPGATGGGYQSIQEAQTVLDEMGGRGRISQGQDGLFRIQADLAGSPTDNPVEFISDPETGQRFIRMGNNLQQVRVAESEITTIEKELAGVDRARTAAGQPPLTPEERMQAIQMYQERRINGSNQENSMLEMMRILIGGPAGQSTEQSGFRFQPPTPGGQPPATATPTPGSTPAPQFNRGAFVNEFLGR